MRSTRILINGGDNMLGRAVNLSLGHQVEGEEFITDSCPAAYYLAKALHPSSNVMYYICKIENNPFAYPVSLK